MKIGIAPAPTAAQCIFIGWEEDLPPPLQGGRSNFPVVECLRKNAGLWLRLNTPGPTAFENTVGYLKAGKAVSRGVSSEAISPLFSLKHRAN